MPAPTQRCHVQHPSIRACERKFINFQVEVQRMKGNATSPTIAVPQRLAAYDPPYYDVLALSSAMAERGRSPGLRGDEADLLNNIDRAQAAAWRERSPYAPPPR